MKLAALESKQKNFGTASRPLSKSGATPARIGILRQGLRFPRKMARRHPPCLEIVSIPETGRSGSFRSRRRSPRIHGDPAASGV